VLSYRSRERVGAGRIASRPRHGCELVCPYRHFWPCGQPVDPISDRLSSPSPATPGHLGQSAAHVPRATGRYWTMPLAASSTASTAHRCCHAQVLRRRALW